MFISRPDTNDNTSRWLITLFLSTNMMICPGYSRPGLLVIYFTVKTGGLEDSLKLRNLICSPTLYCNVINCEAWLRLRFNHERSMSHCN